MLMQNLFRYWTFQVFSPGTVLREKYKAFKALLEYDKAAHDFMAMLEDIYYTQKKCDFQAVVKIYEQFALSVSGMVEEFLKMCPSNYWELRSYFKKFDFYVRFMLAPQEFKFLPPFIIGLDKVLLFNEKIAGGKAFSLSMVNRKLHMPVPNGFVITTNAFHYFMEANDLNKPVNEKLAELDINNFSSLEQTALEIEQLILNAIVPEDIANAVLDAVDLLGKDRNPDNFRIALRSSAVKEDGKTCFAGQYQTILNAAKKDVLNGYKSVIASKYSSNALFYRIYNGILDDETPMAVLVLEMIDSKASGVIYTEDAQEPLSDNLLIHSVWGQGELLVDGKISPDVIRVPKKNPDQFVHIKISEKSKQMIVAPDIATRVIDTDQQIKNTTSLDDISILTLARWGVSLETHFNTPQDIEWCKDKSDTLFILQSRPLNIHPPFIHETADKDQVPPGKNQTIENKIICSGGESICTGIGSGRVYRLEQLEQLDMIPEGSILVVRHALPQFVVAIHKINGIIIETGSRASHFASIAREFNVPAIVNVTHEFSDLVEGCEVTLDAHACIVYHGIVQSMIKETLPEEDFFSKSSFMVKLRYIMNFCAKLELTDPASGSFVPEACRSLHDIIRFVHETAMKEMFFIGNRKGGRRKGAKKLISSIPMLLYILDLGHGIRDDQKNKKNLRPEDIVSIPMKALLKGLSAPGINWTETTHFDWEEYDRIVMAGGIISADSSMFGSYAVLSEKYLNVSFRFGYHFVIIDTICSSSKEDNYILFRFSGGGGTPAGRSLRANFIKGVLAGNGFIVKMKSDLIDAELRNRSLETIKETLDITGRLLGASKLMDMYMKENMDVNLMIDDFMNGRYDFRPIVHEN